MPQLYEGSPRLDARTGGSLVASVVVAVHGNVRDLPGLIGSLGRQSMRADLFELVVVDNHPSPRVDPATFGNPSFSWHIVHEPVPGLSRARNAGIRAASGAFVLITDPDSRPDRNWVEALTSALADEDACVAGGQAIPRLPAGHVLKPELRQWFVPPAWPDHTQELVHPYWIVGCNMGFRRTDPPPAFDEDLGAIGRRHRSCEDLELVIRAQMAAQRVLVVPSAIVHRTVTHGDLRLRNLLGRAFWHGVSVAQLRRKVPAEYILDSYRVRDVIRQGGHLARLTHLARLAGYHGSRIAEKARMRVARQQLPHSHTPAHPARKDADQNV